MGPATSIPPLRADIDALAGLVIAEQLYITANPSLSQAHVDSVLAQVQVLVNSSISGNGEGDAPSCGFGPP